MGIFFPWNWPVQATEMFWAVMLVAIVIIAIVLLCTFLFPTPIKRTRQEVAKKLEDHQHGYGSEAVEAALDTLRSYGHKHATVDWCCSLTHREIKRLDKDSTAQVTVVRYFAVDTQEIRARLDFLDTATWWTYRKFVWGQLRWKDAQPMSIAFIILALLSAYRAALWVAS